MLISMKLILIFQRSQVKTYLLFIQGSIGEGKFVAPTNTVLDSDRFLEY